MYLDFISSRKLHFTLLQILTFSFWSPSHKAALGSIIYGIEERQGVYRDYW